MASLSSLWGQKIETGVTARCMVGGEYVLIVTLLYFLFTCTSENGFILTIVLTTADTTLVLKIFYSHFKSGTS